MNLRIINHQKHIPLNLRLDLSPEFDEKFPSTGDARGSTGLPDENPRSLTGFKSSLRE